MKAFTLLPLEFLMKTNIGISKLRSEIKQKIIGVEIPGRFTLRATYVNGDLKVKTVKKRICVDFFLVLLDLRIYLDVLLRGRTIEKMRAFHFQHLLLSPHSRNKDQFGTNCK